MLNLRKYKEDGELRGGWRGDDDNKINQRCEVGYIAVESGKRKTKERNIEIDYIHQITKFSTHTQRK